jgi:hypothetical protein
MSDITASRILFTGLVFDSVNWVSSLTLFRSKWLAVNVSSLANFVPGVRREKGLKPLCPSVDEDASVGLVKEDEDERKKEREETRRRVKQRNKDTCPALLEFLQSVLASGGGRCGGLDSSRQFWKVSS